MQFLIKGGGVYNDESTSPISFNYGRRLPRLGYYLDNAGRLFYDGAYCTDFNKKYSNTSWYKQRINRTFVTLLTEYLVMGDVQLQFIVINLSLTGCMNLRIFIEL